jgi:hypothetical protein
MRRASAVATWACVAGAACASAGPKTAGTAALGWSLGGEVHVFVTGDRFAGRLYEELTSRDAGRLGDSLAARRLVAVASPVGRRLATVLFPSGAADATLTLARFHAAGACGRPEVVTEMVLAFPPGAGRRAPPSHTAVVAVLERAASATSPESGADASSPRLPRETALELVTRVAQAAERLHGGRRAAAPLGSLVLDPDRATDAGEVLALPRRGGAGHYAVGFRVRFAEPSGDTVLVTGIAESDTSLRRLHWLMRPVRARLARGMMPPGRNGVRYSLRGAVAARRGGAPLLLVNEVADVAARDSRATAIESGDGRVVAAQPLALRCP